MTTAIAEYSPTETALADLRQRYGKVVFDVTTTKGMEDARKGRAEIRGYRTALETKRKEIKAPALERCRLIDDEAKRITAELVALEDPIDELIKAEERRKESERLEKERKERERIEAIQNRIADFASHAASMAGKTSEAISAELVIVEQTVIGESFGEYKVQATIALESALAKLRELHAAAVAHEAEQARIKAEREELARLRAEQEQREKEARAKADAEQRQRDEEARQARAKIASEEREARARILEQQRKADEERAEADRIARERREVEEKQARQRQVEEDARLKVERDRIEAERRAVEERERKAREEIEAKEREERLQQAELMDGMHMLETFVERYGERDEFKTVAKRISGWLSKQKRPA